MYRFIEVRSYDDMVSGSNKMIEGLITVFAVLIVVAAIVSVVVSIILAIKSQRRMRQNIDKMVDNIAKENKQASAQHECRYCGQLINDEEYCPTCGAKQMKDE